MRADRLRGLPPSFFRQYSVDVAQRELVSKKQCGVGPRRHSRDGDGRCWACPHVQVPLIHVCLVKLVAFGVTAAVDCLLLV